MAREKTEQPAEQDKTETAAKGQFTIPDGELNDMQKEYQRLARKRAQTKAAPKK